MPNQPSMRARANHDWKLRSSITTILRIAILLSVMASLACDRNIEPYQAGEQPSSPDLARIFPGPPGGPAEVETAAAESGTPDRSALPPSRAEGSEVVQSGGAAAIEGRIELAPEHAGALPEGGVLFVIARAQGASGGPPLAVLRIQGPKFPLAFHIGPENVMIASMRFEGAISLSARLDEDGNAMTRGSADISSPVLESLAPGATDVVLVLSEPG